MRDDLNKYIHQRKKADKRFADGFDAGYQEFKIGYLLRNARHKSGITQDGASTKTSDLKERHFQNRKPC